MDRSDKQRIEGIVQRILDDFGDDRITIITCTDDGTQRQVVVGLLD